MKSSRFVAGTGLLVMTLIAGCAGDSSSGDGNTPPSDLKTFASHEEIVAAAQQEGGTFEGLTGMDESVNEHIAKGFMAKYPFIKATVTEQPNDENERTLLELQAGQVKFDTLHGGGEGGSYERYLEFSEKYDLLTMAKNGVLDIPVEAINPKQPQTMSVGAGIGAVAWNKKLVSESEVPSTYEDFLDPKWTGKFMTNIEGTNLTLLRQVWGKEKAEKYLTDVLANDPIWTDSDTAGLTAMTAGEFPLALGTNYHSAYRIQLRDPETVGVKVLDPVPVRLTQVQLIRKGSDNPAQALLYLEYLMTPEVQGWLDEYEPAQASIFRAGTLTEKLVHGKQIAALDWPIFLEYQDWATRTQQLWGFPVGEVKGD